MPFLSFRLQAIGICIANAGNGLTGQRRAHDAVAAVTSANAEERCSIGLQPPRSLTDGSA
jgi:hypothetical protein